MLSRKTPLSAIFAVLGIDTSTQCHSDEFDENGGHHNNDDYDGDRFDEHGRSTGNDQDKRRHRVGGDDGNSMSMDSPPRDADGRSRRTSRGVSPQDQLEQSAWCSWERATVRRTGDQSPVVTPRRKAMRSPNAKAPSAVVVPPTEEAAPPGGWPAEIISQLAQKDEEIMFLQRSLMKNVELAAATKKEENELRREYTRCKNQLDLLVALENEDEEAAHKLRQDIVTAQYRANQAKLQVGHASIHTCSSTHAHRTCVSRVLATALAHLPPFHALTLCRTSLTHIRQSLSAG